MDELKARAMPKYQDLVDATKENGEKLDYLCSLKERQYQNDSAQYKKWQKEKIKGARLTLIQLAIGVIAVYLGIIEFNKDNPFVSGFSDTVAKLAGFFL